MDGKGIPVPDLRTALRGQQHAVTSAGTELSVCECYLLCASQQS